MTGLRFGKTGWAIDLVNCDALATQLPEILHGWHITSSPKSEDRSLQLRARITRTKAGWTWRPAKGVPKPRDWDRVPPKSEIRVLTDIHDAALYWFLAENPTLLCLHGASVQIGETLLCFPARGFAGKSTLVACLAAKGHRVYADDVIGLSGTQCTGYAMGFSPRLRSPLPPSLPAKIRDFIGAHQGPSGPGWTYLKLPGKQQAQFGEKHRIGALVTLERRSVTTPEISGLNQATLLKTLVAENIIRQLPMLDIFNRLERLSRRTPRYLLRYDDPVAAAELLTERFS